ncbi:MAG: putative sulfate exporter family transporter [Actinomycetota bacterium]|nr:putative sulfate exporter family transporter [Actinomycetota bacterium]
MDRAIDALEELMPTAELDPLSFADRGRQRRSVIATVAGAGPGLALVGVCVAAAFAFSGLVPAISPLVASVAIGAVLANLGLVPGWARAGTHFAAKRLLRFGVVLLGFQLAVGQVLHLGAAALVVVAVVVAATFFGTQWFGRKLGVSRSLTLLIATGFSICGASAVAAVEGVAEAEEEEVAFAIALVTLCGSLAIGLLPMLRHPLGLSAAGSYGSWVGASVHDVGQVVATAASGGSVAVRAAVIVKLTRVVLLAPMVAGISLARRRNGTPDVEPATPTKPATKTMRPPLLPLFVAGFLAAIALRSTGAIPAGALNAIKSVQNLSLAAALVGLGTGVRLAKLRRVGGRPLLLGLGSWVIVAVVSYAGVLLTHG